MPLALLAGSGHFLNPRASCLSVAALSGHYEAAPIAPHRFACIPRFRDKCLHSRMLSVSDFRRTRKADRNLAVVHSLPNAWRRLCFHMITKQIRPYFLQKPYSALHSFRDFKNGWTACRRIPAKLP
ncbi:hypothetical protein D3C77_472820 [compost metagenome]